MVGVQLEWMQNRLELKADLVNLLSKMEYDCYDTFIDLEEDSSLMKLFDEAKESPDEWPSIFNADRKNFSSGTLRKLSKIPVVAKKMGETFFASLKVENLESVEDKHDELEAEDFKTIIVEQDTIEMDKTMDRTYLASSHINMEMFLARLKSSIERVYQTVMSDMSINADAIEVTIELEDNNVMTATHNCLICRKLLKISYVTKNGKLKQFFTGNMKKHLIKMHNRSKS